MYQTLINIHFHIYIYFSTFLLYPCYVTFLQSRHRALLGKAYKTSANQDNNCQQQRIPKHQVSTGNIFIFQ